MPCKNILEGSLRGALRNGIVFGILSLAIFLAFFAARPGGTLAGSALLMVALMVINRRFAPQALPHRHADASGGGGCGDRGGSRCCCRSTRSITSSGSRASFNQPL